MWCFGQAVNRVTVQPRDLVPLLNINLFLNRNPNKKLTKKIPNETKIPLHIEEGQGIFN